MHHAALVTRLETQREHLALCEEKWGELEHVLRKTEETVHGYDEQRAQAEAAEAESQAEAARIVRKLEQKASKRVALQAEVAAIDAALKEAAEEKERLIAESRALQRRRAAAAAADATPTPPADGE